MMLKRCFNLFDRTFCALLFVILFSHISFATAPRLSSVLPTGGQRGTSIEINLHGERLEDTQEIIFYEPGIEVTKLNSTTNKLVKATVNITPQCDLGEHHLRLRTASGVSELRTFFVGTLRVVQEVEPNNSPAKAQKIKLNTTVTGVITSEDVDCFAVDVKKGELFSVEVEGMRLGRGVFDPRLSVMETNGTVVADVDDTWLAMQDPFVSFIAPKDATYIVQLREATYEGNNDCHYRLHIGNFARPSSVYPLGGKGGETVTFTFFSEATGEFKQDYKLSAVPSEKFGLFAEQNQQVSPSPNWIRVSPFPNILFTNQTPDREHAAAVDFAPPFALNGILSRKGQEDWFRFPATKGIQLEVNVFARQLRSPVDSVIEVFAANGRSLAANDDAGGPDSSLKFTPDNTTNYFVRIRDTLGRFGRDFTYRIEVTPVAPAIAVKIPEVARNDTQSRQYIAVPQGNRFATLISAKRANFNSEEHIDLAHLPEGVSIAADRFTANVDSGPLVFAANADAPISGRLMDLIAIATNADALVTGHYRQDVELVEGPNNTTYYKTAVDKLYVAVVKEAPFQIRIVEPKVPIVQSGSMALEVVAERKAGFEEPIELSMVWNPPGINSQADATIPKGATNAFYQVNANDNAETRSWKIAVIGHANVEGGQVYVSTQLTGLDVTSPFVSGKIKTLVANPGKSSTITLDLQQLKPFSGNAKIRLVGLPDKVTAPEMQISTNDQKVSFDLILDPKCPTGSFKNIFCAVDVMQDGHSMPHNIAQGGILRIVANRPQPTKLAENKEAKK